MLGLKIIWFCCQSQGHFLYPNLLLDPAATANNHSIQLQLQRIETIKKAIILIVVQLSQNDGLVKMYTLNKQITFVCTVLMGHNIYDFSTFYMKII